MGSFTPLITVGLMPGIAPPGSLMLALSLASSACSSGGSAGTPRPPMEDSGARTSDSSGGPTEDVGDGSPEASKTVDLSVTTHDFLQPQAVLEGVEVCIHPALTECVTTDPAGRATLPLPANAEVAVSFDGTTAGHTKLLATITTQASDIKSGWFFADTAAAQAIARAAGFMIDPAKGVLVGQAQTLDGAAGLAGAVLTVTPASGRAPVYHGTDGLPDPTLTATTAFGLATIGEVSPAEYEVSFSGKSCYAGAFAWQGGSGRARAPVVAGYLTLVTMNCQ